jgi:DNA polymerase III epsilon subunit-like protein
MKEFIAELREGDALILDTETSGLNNKAEILQIGIVSLEGEALFNSKVKPAKARRWDEAMRVHGIAWSDVKDAPSIGQLAEQLKKIIYDRLVAIYNADFDTRMLWQSIKADGASSSYQWLHEQDWECVMQAYAEYWGQWNSRYGSYKWQSLTNACRQQGVKIVDAHDALGDARLTAALIRTIEKKFA